MAPPAVVVGPGVPRALGVVSLWVAILERWLALVGALWEGGGGEAEGWGSM